MSRLPLVLLALLLSHAPAAQTDSERLTEGVPVSGALTDASDTLESGEYVAAYYLERPQGGPFGVCLTATAFDPYLVLLAPNDEQFEDDAGGGKRDEACVVMEAAMPGTWEVFATTLTPGEAGPFEIVYRAVTAETQALDAAADDDLARSYALTEEVFALYAEGRYAEATARAREALALREGALGADHPDTAELLNNLALLLQEQGAYAEAHALYERALALLEAALGPGHPDVAVGLGNLAGLFQAQGDFPAARPLFERALAVYEAALGPDHPDTAHGLNNLATLLQEQGDYAEARPLYERALAIFEAAYGPGHPSVATALGNLAGLYENQGDYARARPLFERALAASEAALGPDHPDVAIRLNNLASLLKTQGDYAAARPLFERAVAIAEAALGPDHPLVATGLNNLAGLHEDEGDFATARALYERALAIRERALGPDHPTMATALGNLARVHYAEEDYAGAQALHERALAISEAALSPNHPDVATGLNNLAFALRAQGDLAGAQAAFERAVAIYESALGPKHPSLAAPLNSLALVRAAQGDAEAARPLFARAARLYDGIAEDVLPTLSAAEQRAFVDLDLDNQTSYLISSSTPTSLTSTYALVGGWKGLLLRALRRQTTLAALAEDPAHADDVARLQALRAAVAAAYRNGDPALADLTEEKERLERSLAAALPARADDAWRTHGPAGLADALPEAAALVDLYRYGYWEDGWFTGWRYAAFVTAQTGVLLRVDLGEAEPLEDAVAAWRDAVTRGQPADAETAALAEALWGPIAEALPDGTARLWVSPDGDLARVPWSALAAAHAATAGLLVAQVPSARALLTLLTAPPEATGDGLLLVGGVDFGDGPGFAPLPGTEAEVAALAALAEGEALDPTVLTGTEPTARAVSAALPAAAYAHLATHGFFYGEPEAAYAATRTDVLGAPGAAAGEANRNPLAESGLALAGANDGPGGALTAEELVGLDLSGTRLVVLSACETGRGTEVTGQGVLGLQASFTAAGVRSLLMSLWSVPDASTAALMEHFYRGLWEGDLAPAEALRRAQVMVRSTPGWEAPVHWAAWVLSGEGW